MSIHLTVVGLTLSKHSFRNNKNKEGRGYGVSPRTARTLANIGMVRVEFKRSQMRLGIFHMLRR